MILMQSFKFAAVGLLATLVHILAGLSLIELSFSPFIANFSAFLLAFGLSFIGHHNFSFKGHSLNGNTAFKRFFCVAISSFIFNETLLILFLNFTKLGASVGLFSATVIAAVVTFTICKSWVFKSTGKQDN